MGSCCAEVRRKKGIHFFDMVSSRVFNYTINSGMGNEVSLSNKSFKLAAYGNMNNRVFISGGIEDEIYLNRMYEILEKPYPMINEYSNMQIPRSSHTMIVYKTQFIYVCGGLNASGRIKSCEKFDINENSWDTIPDLTEETDLATGCVFDDIYLYIFGGGNDTEYFGRTGFESLKIEKLDVRVEERGWERIFVQGEYNPPETFCASSIQISYNQILIFGGKTEKFNEDRTVIFDPYSNSLSIVGSLPHNDYFMMTAPKKVANRVFAVGSTGKIYIYHINKKNWKIKQSKKWNKVVQNDGNEHKKNMKYSLKE